jgi:hypothetical protein
MEVLLPEAGMIEKSATPSLLHAPRGHDGVLHRPDQDETDSKYVRELVKSFDKQIISRNFYPDPAIKKYELSVNKETGLANAGFIDRYPMRPYLRGGGMEAQSF